MKNKDYKLGMKMGVVHIAVIIFVFVILLFVYYSRDRLVERMENEDDDKRGKRGMMGPRGRRGERGPTGKAGGEFQVMGRLGDVECLEKDNSGTDSCHATVNKLGGIALGKKGFDMEQVWKHMSDGTLKNMGRDRCLHIKKNEGVGSDDVEMAHCDSDPTRWHYDSNMMLRPVSGNDGWALGTGKGGQLEMVKKEKAKKWTFFS